MTAGLLIGKTRVCNPGRLRLSLLRSAEDLLHDELDELVDGHVGAVFEPGGNDGKQA